MADDTAQSTPAKRQPLPPEEPLLEPRAIPNPDVRQGMIDCYGDGMKFSAILQAHFVILAYLPGLYLLGFGFSDYYELQFPRSCLIAIPPYWIGTLIIVCRRPQKPEATKLDLFLVRYGYLFCLAAVYYYWPLVTAIKHRL